MATIQCNPTCPRPNLTAPIPATADPQPFHDDTHFLPPIVARKPPWKLSVGGIECYRGMLALQQPVVVYAEDSHIGMFARATHLTGVAYFLNPLAPRFLGAGVIQFDFHEFTDFLTLFGMKRPHPTF